MRNRFLTILLPIAAMITFWALTPVAIAYVKDDFSLTFQVWLRYLCSAAALWLFMSLNSTARKSLAVLRSNLRYFLPRLAVTALCTIIFQIFFTWCFFLLQPAFGTLLLQSQVIFSVISGAVFFEAERKLLRSGKAVAGIIFAAAGAAVVIMFRSGGISFEFNAGVLIAIAGALAWSLVGLTNRLWLSQRLHPIVSVASVFSLVTLLMTPAAFLIGNPVIGRPELFKWIAMAGSALLGIAGGQGLYYYLVPRVGLITAASVQLLIPFISGLFAFLIFGDMISALQVAGGLVLLAGCRLIITARGSGGKHSSS